MENQVNAGNQNTQQIGQNPINKTEQNLAKSKINYWMISSIIFALLFLLTLGWHFATIKDGKSTNINTQPSENIPTGSNSPTTTSPTGIPTPITGNLHFTSKELGIGFEYPAELTGPAHDEPASKGKGGSEIKGEEWWRIDFNKTGFEPGYYEVSASTPNYAPSSWEGTPHWLNTKISSTDTEEFVKQKLAAANFQVIKVQKVTSLKNVLGFKVWTLDCYVGCILSRVYLVPLSGIRYNNLLVYTILKSLNAGDDNATIEQAKTLATPEIIKIENNQADVMVGKYASGQDLIFNSLTIDN